MNGPVNRIGQPSVLVAIVNYRTAGLAIDCLDSLVEEMKAHPGARAVIVDNASGDNSCGSIASAIKKRGWNRWAKLVASPVNGGFAQGNNRAIATDRAAGGSPDYVWLLNPDTRVQPGSMQALLKFMDDHPRAGIAGTLLKDRDGQAWPYAFRFPSLLGEVERGARFGPVSRLLRNHAAVQEMGREPAPVDWVSGASMMIRAELLDSVGPMDESYFLYYEETDLCLQARRGGWECWYVPQACVMHIAGQSTGLTGKDAVVRRMPAYWFESRRYYFLKNHGRFYAMTADMLWIVSHLAWRLRRRILALTDHDPQGLLIDFVKHSALLKGESPAPGKPLGSR